MASLLKEIEEKIDMVFNTCVKRFESIDERLTSIEDFLKRNLGSEVSVGSLVPKIERQTSRKRSHHRKDKNFDRTWSNSRIAKRCNSSLDMSLRQKPGIDMDMEDPTPPADDTWIQDSESDTDKGDEKVSVSLEITSGLTDEDLNQSNELDKKFSELNRDVDFDVPSNRWSLLWDYDKKEFKFNSINKFGTELLRQNGIPCCVFKHKRKYIKEGSVPFINVAGVCRSRITKDKCTLRFQFIVDNEPEINEDITLRIKLRGSPNHSDVLVPLGIPSLTHILLTAEQWSEFWDYENKSFKKNWSQLVTRLMNITQCPFCLFYLGSKIIREGRDHFISVTGGCRIPGCKIRIKFTIANIPQPDEEVTVELSVLGNPTHPPKIPPIPRGNITTMIIPSDKWAEFWDYSNMLFKRNWTHLITAVMQSAECPLCYFNLSDKRIRVGHSKFIVVTGGCRTPCCKVRVKVIVTDVPEPDQEVTIELIINGIPTHPGIPDPDEVNEILESKTCSICRREFSSPYQMKKHWRNYHEFKPTGEEQIKELTDAVVATIVTC